MIRLQIIFFLLLCTISAVAAQDMPAERYPAGDTVMESPLLFFWPSYEDIAETSYSISIESNTKKIFESGVSPKRYKRYLYFLCDPVLSDGDYSYKIQCNRTGKPYTLPFYGAYSFPITGTFSLSNQSKRVITIPSCIDSIVNEREKKFSQFDNAVFLFFWRTYLSRYFSFILYDCRLSAVFNNRGNIFRMRCRYGNFTRRILYYSLSFTCKRNRK